MSQMKGITLCADCAYYSMKKHKCTRGATDESDPLASFYGDCPLDDVAPVVRGRWEVHEHPYIKPRQDGWICTNCSFITEDIANGDTNYCPNCGAKMDGDGNA